MKIHIGCKGPKLEGWKRLDMVQWGDHGGHFVDYVQDAKDLSNIESGSCDELYCSNVLEHFSHKETTNVLKEWRRVLRPGGKAWISVPDIMASIELVKRSPAAEWPIYLLYGDQEAPLHYHYINFSFPYLAKKCMDAGFSDIKRIDNLPYGLDDASSYTDNHYGIKISLNVELTA